MLQCSSKSSGAAMITFVTSPSSGVTAASFYQYYAQGLLPIKGSDLYKCVCSNGNYKMEIQSNLAFQPVQNIMKKVSMPIGFSFAGPASPQSTNLPSGSWPRSMGRPWPPSGPWSSSSSFSEANLQVWSTLHWKTDNLDQTATDRILYWVGTDIIMFHEEQQVHLESFRTSLF